MPQVSHRPHLIADPDQPGVPGRVGRAVVFRAGTLTARVTLTGLPPADAATRR
jgi:hypothetical protein